MRSVSGKELIRILEARGWILRRINGSHHIFTKPGLKVLLSVPVHGNRALKLGTQTKLMKLAGLTEEDL